MNKQKKIYIKKYFKNKVYPLGTRRSYENQLIKVRIKCGIKGCKSTKTGVEGYNGQFYIKGILVADLRNQCFICKKHKR